MTVFLPVITPALALERLQQVFPRAAFDSVLSSPVAAAAVSTMIYLGAVEDLSPDATDQRYVRPSMVMWLHDEVLDFTTDGQREAWYVAAMRSKEKVRELVTGWGIDFRQRYEDNSRETVRDESFRAWQDHGAVLKRAGLATSSPLPRWELRAGFAALFDPSLAGDALISSIDLWIETNMSTSAKLKASNARQLAKGDTAVVVRLPSGEQRSLEPGLASSILKGVVEQWAPARLAEPMLITISEPGDKVYITDQKLLRQVGITINVSDLLPDALMADVGVHPLEFWVIEAVATDGPVTEERKQQLIEWAETQGINASQCRFLTAFSSRNSAPARRRLKDLAEGTFAWFLDEPGHELSWHRLEAPVETTLAPVTPIK